MAEVKMQKLQVIIELATSVALEKEEFRTKIPRVIAGVVDPALAEIYRQLEASRGKSKIADGPASEIHFTSVSGVSVSLRCAFLPEFAWSRLGFIAVVPGLPDASAYLRLDEVTKEKIEELVLGELEKAIRRTTFPEEASNV